MVIMRRHRRIRWATGALLAALMCGCGASQQAFPSLSKGASGSTVSFAAWDQCLREHGVSVPAGYDPYHRAAGSPKLRVSVSAIAACAVHEPPAPPLPAAVREQLLAYTKCMRAHGIETPDPTFFPDGNFLITWPAGVGPKLPGFTATDEACHIQVGLGAPAASPSSAG